MRPSLLNFLSFTGFALMVAGILLLYFNGGLFSLSPVVICAQVFALALMIWARATFGGRSFHATARPTQGGLVTRGPYRYLRHPIYASALLLAWAGALGNLSFTNIGFGLLTFAGAMTRILCEETLVKVQYPEYAEYAKKTKRLLPFLF